MAENKEEKSLDERAKELLEQSSMFDDESIVISDEEFNKMTKEELINLCKNLIYLWNMLPENVKYLTSRIGKLMHIVKRDYKPEVGILLRVWWEPVAYELGQILEEYDYERRMIKRTRVRSRIQASITLMIREVLGQEEEPFKKVQTVEAEQY